MNDSIVNVYSRIVDFYRAIWIFRSCDESLRIAICNARSRAVVVRHWGKPRQYKLDATATGICRAIFGRVPEPIGPYGQWTRDIGPDVYGPLLDYLTQHYADELPFAQAE